ncbi:hypothetical protein BDF14DRAFT_1756952 [Spinellus fusiger]|nr:hypothetical protein BDF14DRAFT_1756952 [Spinellus fusiger]
MACCSRLHRKKFIYFAVLLFSGTNYLHRLLSMNIHSFYSLSFSPLTDIYYYNLLLIQLLLSMSCMYCLSFSLHRVSNKFEVKLKYIYIYKVNIICYTLFK